LVKDLAKMFEWPKSTCKQRKKAVLDLRDPIRTTRKILRHAKTRPDAALKAVTAMRWATRFTGAPPGLEELWRMLSSRIRLIKAARIVLKARPIPPLQLKQLVDTTRKIDRPLAAMLALAFITAGRIDDIARLERKAITITHDWIVIDFRTTKANCAARPREDHCTAVDRRLIPTWLRHALREWQKPTPALKRRAYTLLRKTTPTDHVPPHSSHVKFRSNYSLHSIKMSATQQLLEEVSRGALSAPLVSLALKHKRASPVLVETTVGYAANPLLIAKATGIVETTRLLAKALFPEPPRHPRGLWLPDGSFIPIQRPALSHPRKRKSLYDLLSNPTHK
jgi:hypothetical protein